MQRQQVVDADLPAGWRRAVDSIVAFRAAVHVADIARDMGHERVFIAPATLAAIRSDAMSVLGEAMAIGREDIGICSCGCRTCICREEIILAFCARNYARVSGKSPTALAETAIAQFRQFKERLS